MFMNNSLELLSYLFLTLSGWMARTAYHEKPSVILGGTPALHNLKYILCGKLTGNTEIFLMRAK